MIYPGPDQVDEAQDLWDACDHNPTLYVLTLRSVGLLLPLDVPEAEYQLERMLLHGDVVSQVVTGSNTMSP